MANAYSTERKRRDLGDPTDQEFTLKALSYKQQTYDANKAKVDGIISQYKALQLANGADAKYLNERLGKLVSEVNTFGPMDFSSGAVSNAVENHLGQVLDKTVLTGMAQTQKIMALNEEIENVKTKNIDSYNATNEAFARAPVNEYLAQTTPGASISANLHYIPYKDIVGDLQKKLIDIQQHSKDGVYETPILDSNGSPTGRMHKITITGKTQAELQQIGLSLMGDSYNDQLRVNVWSRTGGFKNADRHIESNYKELEKVYNDSISELKSRMTSSMSNEDKKKLESNIKDIEVMKSNLPKQMLEAKKDPVSTLVDFEKKRISSNLGNSIGLLSTKSEQYTVDDYFFQQSNLNIKNAELQLSAEKLQLEREVAMSKINDMDGTGDSSSTKGERLKDTPIIYDKAPAIVGQESNIDTPVKVVDDDLSNKLDNVVNYSLKAVDYLSKTTGSQASDYKQLLRDLRITQPINTSSPTQQDKQRAVQVIARLANTDRYGSIASINMEGERSITGEHSNRSLVKFDFVELYSQFKRAEKNRAEVYKGRTIDFAQSDATFIQNIKTLAGKVDGTIYANKAMTETDANNINAILSTLKTTNSNLRESASPPAEKGLNLRFQYNKANNTFDLYYQTKVKGANKTDLLSEELIKDVPIDLLKSRYPGIVQNSSNSTLNPLYSFGDLGTREISSKKIYFTDRTTNNSNLDVKHLAMDRAKVAPNAPERALLDANNAYEMIKLNSKIPRNNLGEDFNKQLDNNRVAIINGLLQNSENLAKLRTSLRYKTTNSGDPNIQILLKDTSGNILWSMEAENNNMESLVKLNAFTPEIILSKLIGDLTNHYTNDAVRTQNIKPNGYNSILKFLSN